MKKTGQLLKETREAKGVSLQEVSIHLKISSRILKALEEGDTNQLPAKTFLRGFVQSYALFLRLDGAEVLELFQAEMGSTHPKMITKFTESSNSNENQGEANDRFSHGEKVTMTGSASVVTPSAATTQSPVAPTISSTSSTTVSTVTPIAPSLSVDHRTWSRSMKVGTVAVIVLIAAIIYGVIRTIEKYEKEATIVKTEAELEVLPRTPQDPAILPPPLTPDSTGGAPIDSAPSENATPTPGENPPSVVEGVTSSITASPEKANLLPTTPMELKKQETKKEPVINDESTKVEKSEDKTSSETKANSALTPQASTNEPKISRPQEVIIEALDKVSIEYSIDDKPKASLVLTAEKVHTFKGEKKLNFGISDGGSVNIIYNGKDKGVPGHLGKSIQLNFPE